MPDPRDADPLFAVAIVARPKPPIDRETGEPDESKASGRLTLALELIKESTAFTAGSLAVEQFQRANPNHAVLGHIVEPVPCSEASQS